jgi:hypothetical protein
VTGPLSSAPRRRRLSRPCLLAAGLVLGALWLPAAVQAGPTFTIPNPGFAQGANGPFQFQWDGGNLEVYRDTTWDYAVGQSGGGYWVNNQGPGTQIASADWGAWGAFCGAWPGLEYYGPEYSADRQVTAAGIRITGSPFPNDCYSDAGGALLDGIWIHLNSVRIEDTQRPSVAGLAIDGTQASPVGEWLTGAPIYARWASADNAHFTGNTGLELDGRIIDAGNAPPSSEHWLALDPGPDGAHAVRAWRDGGCGDNGFCWGRAWSPAVAYKVDRNPPTAPLLAPATPDTTAPRVMVASGASDGAGSGVAGYEYTKDAGQTVTAALALSEAGQYTVQARALDRVGHPSGWSAPVSVTVTARAESPRPGTAPGEGGSGAVEAPLRVRLPDLSRVRLSHLKVSNGRNRMVGPCRGPKRLCPRHLVALVTTVYGRRLSAVGRFAHPNHRGLRDAFVLLRGPSGRPVTSTFTDRRGRFVLSFLARQAGRYRVAAIGQPEVGTELVVRVRPRVSLKGAPGGQLQLKSPFMLLRGRVGPVKWGRRRPVQLEYLDGTWRPGERPRGTWRFRAQAVTDQRGRFALPYRWKARDFAVLVRVIVPGDRGQATLRGWSRRVAVVVP